MRHPSPPSPRVVAEPCRPGLGGKIGQDRRGFRQDQPVILEDRDVPEGFIARNGAVLCSPPG